MPFVRVKSAVASDPQHEFDVSVDEYEANPDRYKRVGKGTSDESRPAMYVTSTAPVKVSVTKK